MATHNNEPVVVSEPPNPNWPELRSWTLDDLARLGRNEIELPEIRLKRTIDVANLRTSPEF
jgi:hypothetical protein